MSKVEPINHELETKVPYALKGEQAEGSFIQLHPPTSKDMTHVASLKQMFFRALPKGGTAADVDGKDDQDEDITGEAVMTMLYMSDVDINVVLVTAKELFCSVGFIEGETKLTKPIIESMDMDDFEQMIGVYMANFILASALQRLKKK